MGWLDWFIDALMCLLGVVAFVVGLLVVAFAAYVVGWAVTQSFGHAWGWAVGIVAFIPLLAALMATAATVVD